MLFVTNLFLAVGEAHVLFNASWGILETTDISRIRRNPRTWAWEMACFLIMAWDGAVWGGGDGGTHTLFSFCVIVVLMCDTHTHAHT